MYKLIDQLKMDFDGFVKWNKIFYKECLSYLDERNRGIIVECVVRM